MDMKEKNPVRQRARWITLALMLMCTIFVVMSRLLPPLAENMDVLMSSLLILHPSTALFNLPHSLPFLLFLLVMTLITLTLTRRAFRRQRGVWRAISIMCCIVSLATLPVVMSRAEIFYPLEYIYSTTPGHITYHVANYELKFDNTPGSITFSLIYTCLPGDWICQVKITTNGSTEIEVKGDNGAVMMPGAGCFECPYFAHILEDGLYSHSRIPDAPAVITPDRAKDIVELANIFTYVFRAMRWSLDGRTIGLYSEHVGTSTGGLVFYDIPTLKRVHADLPVYPANNPDTYSNAYVDGFAFDDANHLLTLDLTQQQVSVWNLATHSLLEQFSMTHGMMPDGELLNGFNPLEVALRFNRGSRIDDPPFMVISDDGRYMALDMAAEASFEWVNAARDARLAGIDKFSPPECAACIYEPYFYLYDLQTGNREQIFYPETLAGTPSPLHSNIAAFSPDSTWLLIAGRNRRDTFMFNRVTGEFVPFLLIQSSMVWSLDYSPDGQLLALGVNSGRHDDTGSMFEIRLYDAKSLVLLATLDMGYEHPLELQFNAAGTLLAAGSLETIHIWGIPQD